MSRQILPSSTWKPTSRTTLVSLSFPQSLTSCLPCRQPFTPPSSLSHELTISTPGRTRYDRLVLIGSCSTYLSTEALKQAVLEAKNGQDVDRYEQAVFLLQKVAPSEPEAAPDTAWIENTRKSVTAESDRLEAELKGYKNNLIKESIRVSLSKPEPILLC